MTKGLSDTVTPYGDFGWNTLGLQGNGRQGMFSTTKEQMRSYEFVVWASIACDNIIRDTCNQPYCFIDSRNNKEVDISKIPDEILLPFLNDWQGISFKKKVEIMVLGYLLAGNGFLWRTTSTAFGMSKGYPDTFIPLLSNWVKPIVSYDGLYLNAYRITFPGGESIEVDECELIHFKQTSAFNLFWGVGHITKARLTVEGEVSAREYSNEFMYKKATPSFVITESEVRTQEDHNRIMQMIKSKWQGQRSAGDIMYMSGKDIKATPLGMNYKDMQYMEREVYDRQTILSMFGVPPSVAGIPNDSNLAISQEDKATYKDSTCNAILYGLDDVFTSMHLRTYDPYLKLVFKKHANANIDNAIKMLNNGIITPNRAAELVGETADSSDISRETFYIGAGVVPLAFAAEPPAPIQTVLPSPAPAQPPSKFMGDDVIDPKDRRLQDPRNVDLICDFFIKSRTRPKHFQVQYLRSALKSRNAIEEKFVGKIASFFEEEKHRVLAKIKSDWKSFSVKDLPGMSVIYDLSEEEDLLTAKMTPLYTSGVQRSISDVNKINGSNINISLSNPYVKSAISKLGDRITGTVDGRGNKIDVAQSTKNELQNILTNAVNDNLSLSELQDQIQNKFDEWQGYRARRIARTESRAAWDAGAKVAYTEIGVKTIDVVGCTEFEAEWDCGAQGVPLDEVDSLAFHPNHNGCFAPSEEN